MPYSIVKKGSGYGVVSPHGAHFSKKPQTHAMAVKQLRAIEMHTRGEHFRQGAQSGR